MEKYSSRHLVPRKDTYFLNSTGGPGAAVGFAVGLAVVVALVAFGSFTMLRRRKHRIAEQAKLERQKKWYEAELRREREMEMTQGLGHQGEAQSANAMGSAAPGSSQSPPEYQYDGVMMPPRAFDQGAIR
jgi:hypothetical protein